MARPCKSINVTNKHFTKEELQARREQEEKLKGGTDKIKPPGYLNKQQKKLFKHIVKELHNANVLTNLDVYILSTCVIAINRLQEIEKMINENVELLQDKTLLSVKDKYTKDLFRCCSELSLSPQSRAKLGNLNVQAKKDFEDPVLKALAGDEE